MAVFGLLSLQELVPRQLARVCHSVNMEWGVKENRVAVIALQNCGTYCFQIFELLTPLKIHDCSSVGQLNVTRSSGGLKTGLNQDV